jgi:hypothetical protein
MNTAIILTHAVSVQAVDSDVLGAGSIGRCDMPRAKISLLRGMSPAVARTTFLHEVLHFVSDTLDLDMTEAQISGAAAGVQSLLAANPGVLKKVVEMTKGKGGGDV